MVQPKRRRGRSPALVRSGGTADSGGGEQPEKHFEAAAAAGERLGVGGVWEL